MRSLKRTSSTTQPPPANGLDRCVSLTMRSYGREAARLLAIAEPRARNRPNVPEIPTLWSQSRLDCLDPSENPCRNYEDIRTEPGLKCTIPLSWATVRQSPDSTYYVSR